MKKNNIKYGDFFELQGHRLICGDARDPEIIKRLMGSEKVKVINCDVPYGIAVTESKQGFAGSNKHKIIANDQIQTDESYVKFTKDWLEAIKPYLSTRNSCYIFNSDRMIFALREGMLAAGFKFSQLIVWVKSHAVVGRLNYLPQHELIAFGWFGTHEFRKSQDKSVLFYPKPSKSKLHPTMKPVPLIRNLILNSSQVNDVIFDGFLGSGSCILACEQTKRRCYGSEIDPEYCQVIINRVEKVFGIKAVKVKEGVKND